MQSQVLSMSSKYGDKRTNVYSKAERKSVLLGTGVLSMSSKSRVKRTYIWGKSQQTCVLFAGQQEREVQNGQLNFITVQRQKKVICRSASSIKGHA